MHERPERLTERNGLQDAARNRSAGKASGQYNRRFAPILSMCRSEGGRAERCGNLTSIARPVVAYRRKNTRREPTKAALRDIMATGFYSHPDCLQHDNGQWHPECPARLQAIEDQLIASRIDSLIEREEAPLAEETDLARVHTQAHIDYIKSRTPESGRSRNRSRYDRCARRPITPRCARRARRSRRPMRSSKAVTTTRSAACGRRAITRSPRARWASASSTTSRSPRVMRSKCTGLQRVAIIDFDVHHGNGTEAAF